MNEALPLPVDKWNFIFGGMSYKDFKRFVYDRACDGQWSPGLACRCIEVLITIEGMHSRSIFGFTSYRKTLEMREDAWRLLKGATCS